MANQNTVSSSFTFEGVGIHYGAMARVTVHPAIPGSGRVFRLSPNPTVIPARAEYVIDATRCTTLGLDGSRISTVEHVLSALAALEIDNAIIEVDGPEIPILDGSALPFVEAIRSAGITEQDCPAKTIALKDIVELVDGNSHITAAPWNGYVLSVTTDFDEWVDGAAVAEVQIGTGSDSFVEQVAPARTFAFRSEVDMLLAAGLAKGGSLDNALIIDPPETFSSPLRLPAEWCAHKLLDVIGDLGLLDARPMMKITARRAGHRLNTRLAAVLRSKIAATE